MTDFLKHTTSKMRNGDVMLCCCRYLKLDDAPIIDPVIIQMDEDEDSDSEAAEGDVDMSFTGDVGCAFCGDRQDKDGWLGCDTCVRWQHRCCTPQPSRRLADKTTRDGTVWRCFWCQAVADIGSSGTTTCIKCLKKGKSGDPGWVICADGVRACMVACHVACLVDENTVLVNWTCPSCR